MKSECYEEEKKGVSLPILWSNQHIDFIDSAFKNPDALLPAVLYRVRNTNGKSYKLIRTKW